MLGIDQKWINIVNQMRSFTKAQLKIEGKLAGEITFSKGLKRGFGLSVIFSDTYRKYSEMMITIKNTVLHALLLAGDQVVFTHVEDGVRYMMRNLME
jgi:hypothetical protein